MRSVTRSRDIRQRADELERATLSTWAVAASESKGRERHEEPDSFRTAFQVDRDRVLCCAAMGTLADKPLALPASHFPTLLQHSARVAAAARWLASALRLNTDLTEAIAYAARLGAPPFGDAGAQALSDVMGEPFAVGDQSLRVVEQDEQDGAGQGLNLTWEVRDGVVHAAWEQTPAATLEGQVVRWADRVVAVVEHWTQAGEPALPPEVGQWGEEQPGTLASALLGDVATASAGRLEIAAGQWGESALRALADAVACSPRRDAVTGEHDRATHVVASLVVYEIERSRSRDLRAAVDRLCRWSDRQALAAYRDRFLPAG